MTTIDWTSERPEVLNLKAVNDTLRNEGYEISPLIGDEHVNNFLYKITVVVKQDEKIIGGKKVVFQIAEINGKNIAGLVIIGEQTKSLTTESMVNASLQEWNSIK